eukprot:504461-Amphidinium_carterae.1
MEIQTHPTGFTRGYYAEETDCCGNAYCIVGLRTSWTYTEFWRLAPLWRWDYKLMIVLELSLSTTSFNFINVTGGNKFQDIRNLQGLPSKEGPTR